MSERAEPVPVGAPRRAASATAPRPSHLSAEMLERARAGHRPLSRASFGADPALPSGPGAGRVAHARGDGRHRRSGRGDPGRGVRHGHLLRHAAHRAGGHLPGGGVHQHRLPAQRRRRTARARRVDARASTPAAPPPTGASPWRRPSAWPTATGRRACRSTTASSGPRHRRPSTGWWPSCAAGARTADIPEHGTLNRVRRTTGLDADPALVASERAAMADAQAQRAAAAAAAKEANDANGGSGTAGGGS